MKRWCIGICLLSLWWYREPLFAHSGCGHDPNQGEEKGVCHWSPQKQACGQVDIQVAGPGLIQNFVQVCGKVGLHPDHLAYVVPKVSGVVWQIQKTVGNSVEKGELLAIIESPDIAEAKALYVLAEADRETSQKILEQEECLRGISPLQDFLQARLSAEKAAIGVELAKQRLYALGLSDADIQDIEEETGEKTRFYSLKSPLKGKVLQRHLSLGEFTHRETKVFSIGNFDRIWIEMHVPSTDIGYLDEGLPVLIVSALGHEEGATICQFTPTINEETRMTTAIALVENSTGVWTPGEFVSVKIETDKTEVPLVVPRDAIQYLKGSPVVFIAHGETFTPSIVTLGRKDAHNIEILSGLQVGQHYAAHNTFCIKADYEKEEVEHHH